MIILITGGSGMAGKALCDKLSLSGHEIRILSRTIKKTPYKCFRWNVPEGYIDEDALNDVDVIVHLSGASVADGRWTASRKAEILSSRVDSALLIFNTLKARNQKIKRFITASGTGFYGSQLNKVLDEQSGKGYGFLADVCDLWEKSGRKFETIGSQVYVNRIGIVMSEKGGFVLKIKGMMEKYMAAELGTGKQITSWIHLADLVSIIEKQIQGTLKPGTYNAVSPNSVSHHELMKTLSIKIGRRIILPNIPFLVLRIIFGELAYELTANQDVAPKQLLKQNFQYEFPTIIEAIDNLKL